VFGWLTDASSRRGLRIAAPDADRWEFLPYPDLGALARRWAGALAGAGVEPGATAMVVSSCGADFVAAFYGALLAGVTPAPVAPPEAFGSAADYRDRLARTARLTGARALLAVPAVHAGLFAEATAEQKLAVLCAPAPDCEAVGGPPAPPDTALVQLSSGSTGFPKAVRLSRQAVESQLRMLRTWLGSVPEDPHASWLPLHHDMGLIGMMMNPLALGADLWLMEPREFIRSPLRWVRRFGADGCAVSAAPGLAVELVLRRVGSDDLAGMDFGSWHSLVLGAEPLDPGALAAFVRLLEPYGLDPAAVKPAYGMAEATLAVTGARPGEAPGSVAVDTAALVPGRRVPLGDGAGRSRITGCGVPLAGVTVTVADGSGAPLPDGVLGEILVDSPALGSEIVDEADGARPFPRPYATGDAGFTVDGRLYVLGRLGDGLKRAGTWLGSEDVQRVAAGASPRPARTVAVLGVGPAGETAYLVVEGTLDGAQAARIGAAVAARHTGIHLVVADAPAGWIDRTSSGKPRRAAMWRRLLDGDLDQRVRWRDGLPATPAESLSPVSQGE
jgi:acyl-CoA synthetase (AMP-forming)/AMP-acid ligase II